MITPSPFPLSLQAHSSQAWLITAERIDPRSELEEEFVALFTVSTPSTTILRITLDLYASTFLSDQDQGSIVRTEHDTSPAASYMYLNDGSVWQDQIVCGHNPGLRSRRIYDLRLETDDRGYNLLVWREPHILVYDDRRQVEWWDEGRVVLTAQEV